MKRGVPAVLVAGLLLLSSACGDDDDNVDPTTTAGEPTTTTSPTTTEATTTTAAPDPAEEVKAAYLAYWEMYVAVNDPPNPNDPLIAQLTTGPALTALLDIINSNIEMGTVIRRPANSVTTNRIQAVAFQTEMSAVVSDCGTDDLVVVEAATGEVINDDVITYQIEATLLIEDGLWKVFEYEFVQRWEGVAGCAA